MSRSKDSNYLLFSDVHLGADLVQHVRPTTLGRLKQLARVDRELTAMLAWYRERGDPERPWCLVIAGDLVDFIGMSIAPLPDSPVETALNDEERMHGLGSARDHAAVKMRAVAQRHPLVFEELARFVSAGHRLVLVRGNHDVDFHWEAARDAFVEAVSSHMDEHLRRNEALYEEARGRIEFHPWFYYVHGLLYVEHGHQFDAVCSYPHLLAPISSADPKRLHWSLSDWLLRVVSRPTPGLGSEGHEDRTPVDYLRFAFSLGILGALRLGARYMRALLGALRLGRDALRDGARSIREEHERRMTELAHRARVRVEHLRALAALWPTPVSSGILGVARNAFVDRIALGLLTLLLTVVLLALNLPLGAQLGLTVVLIAVYALFSLWSVRTRARELDPGSLMRRSARRIAELFPTRFIVMGHTHAPLLERIDDAVTYVNLGNWGVDDLDGETADAPRTHLVLRYVDGLHRAEFCRWDPEKGPRPVAGLG